LDEETTRQFAKDLATEKDITHLIHNAGIILPNLLEDMHSDDLLTLTKLHAGSALILMQAFVPFMKDHGFGRVIFNSSRASVGLETRSAYSYSKAGIIGMARTWALELAPFGVTVNTVAPGPVLTDQFWGLVEKDSAQQVKIAASLPVRRIGKPEDVARAILFFSDPENSYVTGQTLYVCGGSSITSG
jgi:NAD(P)-dependent dehydrogenase (short-subunit alcohol dehydrogenase family)